MEIVNNFQWQVARNFTNRLRPAAPCYYSSSNPCSKNQLTAQQMASFICVFCAMLAALPPGVGVNSSRNPDLRLARPSAAVECEKFALKSLLPLTLGNAEVEIPLQIQHLRGI